MKEAFLSNEAVILLDQDFSCLEFNELVKNFQYLVASRFHSIVHAFKNGVPCIALGWATKYYELLRLFDQEQYVMDVRGKIETDQIIALIEQMEAQYAYASASIRAKLADIQKQNVFDVLRQREKEIE